jgi:non-specific serine/threonine protein kinase
LEVLTVRIAQKLWNSILCSVTVTHTNKACINGPDENIERPRELAGLPPESLDESLPSSPVLPPLEESVFMRQGDYWTIRYQGQVAILKATRGLDCLCYLLRRPAQDVHVSELLATPIDLPVLASLGSLREAGCDAVTLGLQDAGPSIDSKAKAEYKRRIAQLRNDLEQAVQFNDFYRVARIRSEMDAIAEQLADAVGLGGRNRRASPNAERARSAVTKCVKKAIHKIGEANPSLGYHLAARIRTGYFCSYNPHPERPVNWKF